MWIEVMLRWLLVVVPVLPIGLMGPAMELPRSAAGPEVVAVSPTPLATPRPTAVASPSATPSPTPTAGVVPSKSPQPVARVTPRPVVVAADKDMAPESVCPGQNDLIRYVTVLACMTSYTRRQHGVSAVRTNAVLGAAATAKVQDLVKCGLSHTACGRSMDYWLDAKGYASPCSAENIAWGQKTPGQVFAGWMKSPGHRANILRAGYVDIGVATAVGPAGQTWVMELGGC